MAATSLFFISRPPSMRGRSSSPSLLPRYAHPLPSGLLPHPLRRLRLPGRAGGLPWPPAGLFPRPRTLPCRGCRMSQNAIPLPILGNDDSRRAASRKSELLAALEAQQAGLSELYSEWMRVHRGNPATGE